MASNPSAAAGPAPADLPSADDRQWAMLCHLSAMLLYAGLVGGILVPLVIWLLKREGKPFVDDQGRETVNFQITIVLGLVVAMPLCFVLVGIPLVIGLLLYHFIATIVAAVRSNEGVRYRYPYCWRPISYRGP